MNPEQTPARSSSACAPPIRIRPPNCTTAMCFELLIAVVLSAQATDKGVNKATAKLFRSPTHRATFSIWARRV